MAKQKLLRLSLPRGTEPIRASRFREAMAKAGDGLLPPAFFHYTEAGMPCSTGSPCIRFVGGRSWIGILTNSSRDPVFDAAVGLAIQTATTIVGQPLAVTVENIEFDLQPSLYPRQYFLRDMALKRRGPEPRGKPVQQLAAQRIAAHIALTGSELGIDIPTDEQLGIVFHETRQVGMPIGGKNQSTECVTLVSGLFSMNVDLAGMWQVGNLQSRGYGRIIAVRSGVHGVRAHAMADAELGA
ncbi:TPA: hypothetical protein QDA91_003115 [Burkholderia vietnamiensis]|nr:hypothetical protein [Burkholderia vietnamiensis]